MKVKVLYACERPYVSKKDGQAKTWREIQYVSEDTQENSSGFTVGNHIETEKNISPDFNMKGLKMGGKYEFFYDRNRFGTAVLTSAVEC